jgi:hypothetical protein
VSVKYAAAVVAAFTLALASFGGASGQQQTFYTIQAGPVIPPAATAQPLPEGYYYGGCFGTGNQQRTTAHVSQGSGHYSRTVGLSGHNLSGHNMNVNQQCGSGHPTARPSFRPPQPRPSLHPVPHSS